MLCTFWFKRKKNIRKETDHMSSVIWLQWIIFKEEKESILKNKIWKCKVYELYNYKPYAYCHDPVTVVGWPLLPKYNYVTSNYRNMTNTVCDVWLNTELCYCTFRLLITKCLSVLIAQQQCKLQHCPGRDIYMYSFVQSSYNLLL